MTLVFAEARGVCPHCPPLSLSSSPTQPCCRGPKELEVAFLAESPGDEQPLSERCLLGCRVWTGVQMMITEASLGSWRDSDCHADL